MIYELWENAEISAIAHVDDESHEVKWMMDDSNFQRYLETHTKLKDGTKFDSKNPDHWKQLPNIYRGAYFQVNELTDEEFMEPDQDWMDEEPFSEEVEKEHSENLGKAFEESKHPRRAKGETGGGEFAVKPGEAVGKGPDKVKVVQTKPGKMGGNVTPQETEFSKFLLTKPEGFSERPDRPAPNKGWMVSIPREEDQELKVDYDALQKDPQPLAEYVHRNSDKVTQSPDLYFGGWKDEKGVFTLDISQNIQNTREAVQAGKDRKQDAIFNVETFETIYAKDYDKYLKD
jgi:hypothetical protein